MGTPAPGAPRVSSCPIAPMGGLMALRKIPLLVALLSAAVSLSGCGSEPPQPGELRVTSEPVGAAILVDGQGTGQVTPHTFADLEGGTYVVSVLLEGWAVFPGQRTVQ